MSEKVKVKIARNVLHLPAIALRGLVVFPNNIIHFEVGRPKSIAAIEAAMRTNSSIFLVAQREMDVEEPALRDLYSYGVIAEIKQVLRVSDELVKVLVEGRTRARQRRRQVPAQHGARRAGARQRRRQTHPHRSAGAQPERML